MIFNNPEKRNAMSPDIVDAMRAALEDYATDSAVRVVVLKGAGDKAFVSRRRYFQVQRDPVHAGTGAARGGALGSRKSRLTGTPKTDDCDDSWLPPGRSLGVAISWDLRIAAEGSRFGVPAAKLGVGYRYSGVKYLVDVVGRSFTAKIFYTGRQFSVDEALQMGLVNRVLPPAEFESYVVDYAKTMASNAPLTLAAVKRCLLKCDVRKQLRADRAAIRGGTFAIITRRHVVSERSVRFAQLCSKLCGAAPSSRTANFVRPVLSRTAMLTLWPSLRQ